MDESRKTLVERVGGIVPVDSDSFVDPVKNFDKFRQLIVSSEQVVIDAADQIVAALPRLSNEKIELIISATATVQKKLWYLHAACVAQLLKNQVPLPGGRGKKANGDGRIEWIKNKAAELGIKPTKLREDLRINEVFGQRFIAKKLGNLKELPNEGEDGNSIERIQLALSDWEHKQLAKNFPDYKNKITHDAAAEFIENFAFVSNDDKDIYSSSFFPHPRLVREHYVVLSKMTNEDDAREKLQEVIKRITIEHEVITAEKLRNEIFVKSDSQGTHFKLQHRVKFGRVSGNIEFTLTEEDFTLFNEIVKLSLAINFEKFDIRNTFVWPDLLAETGDGYRIIQRALQGYLTLLKNDQKTWAIERSFDPENYTLERQKAKQKAIDYAHKMWNRHRLDAKKLEEIELELKKIVPGSEPDSELYQRYQKQLTIVAKAKINAEIAHAEYVAEENYRVEKIIELDSKAEKVKTKKIKKDPK